MNRIAAQTVEAVARNQKSVKIDGEWYSSFNPLSPCPDRGDIVSFDYSMKGKYRNIQGKVKVNKAAGTSGPGGKKPDYNLGVELGHASNLAQRMMEEYNHYRYCNDDNGAMLLPGSPEYYKQFLAYTEDIYGMMRKIKDRKANPEPAATDRKPVADLAVTDDDIF